MKKRFVLVGMLLALVLIMGACGHKNTVTKENTQSTSSSTSQAPLTITDKDSVAKDGAKQTGNDLTAAKDGAKQTGNDLTAAKDDAKQLPVTGSTANRNLEKNIELQYEKPYELGDTQPIKELPVYYANFRIKYLDNGCKLVTDGENFRLLLVPRGKTAPKGVIADKTIYIPLKSVMTLSSTFVGAMAKMNVLDSLKAVTTSQNYWYIPEVKEALNRGAIKYVGGDNMEPPDYELVKSIEPDLAFVYTGTVGQRHIMKKFDEMGIRYAVNNEYLESNYLGRMEWIKFTAAFYDKELEAEKLFNDAVKSINKTKAKVDGLKKPKIAWGLSWMGKVYVSNADSYVGKWIIDCGGDYVFKSIGKGSDTQVSMEDFYAKAKDADILIFSSTTNYMKDPTIRGIIKDNPLFANIKAVKNGEVWAYAPDWWQTIPETSLFVEDIAAVFHPEVFEGHKFCKLVKLPMS